MRRHYKVLLRALLSLALSGAIISLLVGKMNPLLWPLAFRPLSLITAFLLFQWLSSCPRQD